MEVCTIIVGTNKTREILWWRQVVWHSHNVSEVAYVMLTSAEIERIKNAKTEDVQRLLRDIYQWVNE